MSKCRTHICKAQCCYNVPLPVGFLEAHEGRIITPVIGQVNMGSHPVFSDSIVFLTDRDIDKNKCPFLTVTNRCNVYEDRPEICRSYGDGETPLSTCKFRKP